MTDRAEKEYIEKLVAHAEESLRMLSNKGKSERERMVCAAFLRCLGVSFSSPELIAVENDPPDVKYQQAEFEVLELLDKNRRRGDEFKERYGTLKNAKSLDDTLLAFRSPTPITFQGLFTQLIDALLEKSERYGKEICASLDALILCNLRNRFLDPNSKYPSIESLKKQGWRSVSFVFPPYSHVIFAKDTSPKVLRSNAGKTRMKWKNLDSFFAYRKL